MSPSLFQSLLVLLPLGVSAAPQFQQANPDPATQVIEITAAAPVPQNGMQLDAVNPNVMTGNQQVNATTYPINFAEWDKVWAASPNSTLLTAPNGVVDTTVTVRTGDEAEIAALSDTLAAMDMERPDCQDRWPGDRGYDPNDECARGGGSGRGGGGGGMGGGTDCQGRYPDEAGFTPDDCYDGGGGGSGGGSRSTRFYLEFNIGGRSAIEVSRYVLFEHRPTRKFLYNQEGVGPIRPSSARPALANFPGFLD